MAQVSTQAQLAAAIAESDPNIQIAADFYIDTRQIIGYATTISSAEGGPYTLTKSGYRNFSMFLIQDGGSLTLQNIILDGAKSTITITDDSPLVNVDTGTLIVAAGSVLQNSKAHGIVAFDSWNTAVTVIVQDDAVIRDNESRFYGGGIRVRFTNINSSMRISGQVRIENNTAPSGGGGIHYSSSAQQPLIIEDQVRITGNSAPNGAGIMVERGSMTLRGRVLVLSNQGEVSGGICFNGNNLLVEGGVTIQDNLASNEDSTGGGICLVPESPAAISIHGLIQSNTASQGGGVFIDAPENGTLDFTGTQFIGNHAVSASRSGGGLCINLRANNETPLPITLQNTTFNKNTAASGGGLSIVYPEGSGGTAPFTLNATDTLFLANTAALNGGGANLIFPGYSAALFEGGEFFSNEAASGGGLYAAFSDNSAFSLTLEGVKIDYNRAQESGGGIFISGSDGSTTKLSECTFTENTGDQGGGLYFSHEGSGSSALTLESVTMSGNSVQKAGGAIFLGEGGIRADLIQVFLSNNGALDGDGGGLYSAGGTGRISIQFDSHIEGNSAVSGGGIYHAGDRVLTLYNVYFLDNNVAATGVDIYNDGPLELLAAEDPSVELGVMNIPDGLYLLNRDAVPTLIERPDWDSVVQLERSEYVSPNETGIPIVVAAFHEPLRAEDASVFRKPVSGFDGWEIRLESEGFEVVLAPVLYAIRYENTQGAENPNPDSYTALTPTITLLPLVNRTGYRFTGWFDALEGGVQVTEIPTGSTDDKTLYARWEVVEYTVTYYGNDAGGPTAENVPPSQRVQGGERATLSDERPTRTGFAFTGWNTDPGGSGTGYPSGGTIPNVLADVGLYAQWEALPPIIHLVTYEPNDAGGPSAQNMPESQRFEEGQIARLSTTIPTRTGFHFQNWNTQPNGYGDAYQAGQVLEAIYADLTLYAQWQYVDYTLTYHGNDEGGPPAQNIPIQQYFHVELVFPLSDAVPTREGFRFTSWNTQPDGGGTAYQPSASFGPAIGDADLYAQWEATPPALHLLTYEPNDADGPSAENIPDQEEVTEGETTELSAAIPIRTGYRFLNWNTAPDGTGTIYQPGQTAGPFYDDLTIYAQWERVEYTLAYHGNDAGGPAAQNIPDPQPIYEEQAVQLSDTVPTREGYRFTGWNTQPSGGGTAYRPGDSFGPATADADLYAQWEVLPPTIYLLSYEPNDAGGPAAQNIPGQQEIAEGETAGLSALIPTRTGYRFLNWNTAPDGTGTIYQPGQTAGPFYDDLTIYAQWGRVEHMLTYHGNDEAGPPAQWIPFPQPVPEGDVILLPDVIPTRESYRFIGWNTRPDGGGTAYQPGDPFGPIFADDDLYAQWTALPPSIHTLTYYGNDAGGPAAQNIPGPVPVLDGQNVTLSDTIPTREGFAFSGWNTDPAGTGAAYRPGDTISDVRTDIGLYAQWIPLPPPICYTLTYCGNDSGGSPACCIPCPQHVHAGQCVRTSCCAPYRACYCFTGWNTDPCGRGRMVCPGQTICPVTGDICLYAQWRRLPPPKPCYTCHKWPD